MPREVMFMSGGKGVPVEILFKLRTAIGAIVNLPGVPWKVKRQLLMSEVDEGDLEEFLTWFNGSVHEEGRGS